MQDSDEWKCPFDEKLIKDIYPTYSHQQFLKYLSNPVINYSLGCMFGSFIGDAIGSYLQFSGIVTEDLIEKAMEMSAGGPFNLREGQVTDDSQMSFHMLKALSKFNYRSPIEEQRQGLITNIAKEYVQWMDSNPFDIGITCRNGIKILKQQMSKKGLFSKQVDEDIFQKIYKANNKSQSNGSLMRITPLVFFASLISIGPIQNTGAKSFEEIKALVKDQIRLVHSNDKVITSSLIWFRTLYILSIRKDNKSFQSIWNTVKQYSESKLNDWFLQVNQEPMNATKNQGWAKIAWTYCMQQLKQISTEISKANPNYKFDEFYYKQIIRKIVGRAGDTDTNAAIIGGMLGALVGFKNLPPEYLRKMMRLDFADKKNAKKHDRSQFYQPRHALALAYECIQKNFKTAPQHPKY